MGSFPPYPVFLTLGGRKEEIVVEKSNRLLPCLFILVEGHPEIMFQSFLVILLLYRFDPINCTLVVLLQTTLLSVQPAIGTYHFEVVLNSIS